MRSGFFVLDIRLAAMLVVLLFVPLLAAAEPPDKPLLRDDFDSKLTLDWEKIRPDSSHVSLETHPGKLTITTQSGSIFRLKADAKNIFLADVPDGATDFVVTTCIENFLPERPWQQAGLLVYDDDDNYVKWVREYSDGGFPVLSVVWESGQEVWENGQDPEESSCPAEVNKKRFWLRVTKRGNLYQCAVSPDGETFTTYGVIPWSKGPPKKVGLVAKNGPSSSEIEAQFDFFELRGLSDAEKEDPVCNLRRALQGKWKAIDRQIDGKPITKDPATFLIVEPGTLTLKEKGSLGVSYTVDPAPTPNRITLIPRHGVGRLLNGIFSLEGDTLTLCLNPKPNGPAPDKLETTKGDGYMLLKLQRAEKGD